jgi:DNA polymerase-3 subunit delta'
VSEPAAITRPVGHEGIAARLEAAALAHADGRPSELAHAFLMVGAAGVGKFHTARWWAARLLCERPAVCDSSDSSDSSGPPCPSCRQVAAGGHPDVTIVEPASPGKQMGIDEARQLIHAMSLKPARRGPRVAIVRDAQLLTLHAQSALLKLLEEPPGFAVIVLVTENPASLLATLRSRCQILRFGTLAREEVVELLLAHGRPPELARAAAAISAGSIGRALACDEDTLADRVALLEAFEGFRDGEVSLDTMVEDLLDRQSASRSGLTTVFEWQMEKVESSLGYPTREESDRLDAILQELGTSDAGSLLEEASRIRWIMGALERRANARLAIRDLLLDIRKS